MILAACMQALISATIKWVASSTPISLQLIFYYLIPILYFLPLILKNGFDLYKPRNFPIHFIRGFFSISSVCCFFYAIKYIPLGMSTTLFNMIPFFVPLIAHLFLKEKVSLTTYLGLSIALPGVLLLINLQFISFSIFHVMVGLFAAVLMAMSMVLLRYLVREKESIHQIVFNQYSSCSLIALLFIGLEAIYNPFAFDIAKSHMSVGTFFLLIGLGALSIGTQICFSKAAQRMAAAKFAPFLYLSVPISSVLGILIWNQNLSLNMIIGSCLIFIGLCICSLEKYPLKKLS